MFLLTRQNNKIIPKGREQYIIYELYLSTSKMYNLGVVAHPIPRLDNFMFANN